MFTNNCKINYQGLAVSIEGQSVIHNVMKRLYGMSPSDGTLGLQLTTGESDVSGTLVLKSLQLNLEFNAIGSNPVEVANQLSEELQTQIRLWLSRRRFQTA